MATKKQAQSAVDKFGGTLCEKTYDEYMHSWSIYVDAPDGKCWVDGGSTALVYRWFPYAGDKVSDIYDDIIKDVSYGVMDFIEE